jgi:UDP-N-acetylmuramoyl-tripeptide--D-alanyl-D-alanine ligase
MVLTAAMVATATGGTLTSGRGDRPLEGFAIDSRTLQRGDLFFAIVAARDGHDFVDDAIARGAAGAVVARDLWPVDQEAAIVRVEDTTRALQDLAREVRRESAAKVVAITGSAGKTTTKETIAAFLSERYRVAKNKGNLNNHLGLPLSLLELRHGADVAVMELGMNHAGEIRLLVGIAEPDIRVWTNVGDAHLGHFASADAIADAKAEILDGARGGDVLVCNADDALLMARALAFPGRIVTFGVHAGADVRAEDIVERGIGGTEFTLCTAHGSAGVTLPLLGRGNLSNVLAAAAVAGVLDVPLAEIAERCATLAPAAHRGAVLRLASGVVVVDDSYNSSPAALTQALGVIAAERGAPRKAAVLGEMLELGVHSAALHRACGQVAARIGLDRLITVGGHAAEEMATAAIEAGLPPQRVTWAPLADAAAGLILQWLAPGDLVLVKGSRGIKTDIVVDRIVAERA